MLLFDKTATLISRAVQNGNEFYVCTVYEGVSWSGSRAIRDGAGGAVSSGEYRVRIPAGILTALPRTGDYMVLGEARGITAFSELAGREYFRILRVSDNRSGQLKHMAVSGR